MKLARFRWDEPDETWVGRLDGTTLTPLACGDAARNQADLLRFAMAHRAGAGATGLRALAEPVDVTEVELLAPVPSPPAVRDFYAFEAHVATARKSRGLDMDPDWYELPVFYFSNPGAILGPGDEVHAPLGSAELDYELEVAAVVGMTVRDCTPEAGLDAIAGFTVLGDWSARDVQRREMRQGLGPAKGKDFATSVGPVLVTPDELPEFSTGRPKAAMVARVNGQEWSRGDLGDIHFGWGELVAHAARDATLRVGDIIGSGTVGTGCILELSMVDGSEGYRYLQPGDVVELEVEGIGVLRTPVGARPPTR